jgi:hypothetical protein
MFYLACSFKSGTVFIGRYVWNVCCFVFTFTVTNFSMFCTLPSSDDNEHNEYYNLYVVLNQSCCQDLSVSQIVLETSNQAVLNQVLVLLS